MEKLFLIFSLTWYTLWNRFPIQSVQRVTEEVVLNEPLAHFPEEPEVQRPLNT